MSWIYLHGLIIAAKCPAVIYYHLYHHSAIGQFLSFLWLVVCRTIFIALCHVVMASYIIWSNYKNMDSIAFWVILFPVYAGLIAELLLYRINIVILRTKYTKWKNK